MAWQKQHKLQSKERILTSAAALFTRFGFEKISINQVMENADMTRGAFYAHFSSKSDLYAQAIGKAANQAANQQLDGQPQCLKILSERYLNTAHRDQQMEYLCLLASLITDINQQDETVKATYTELFKQFLGNTNQYTQNEQRALQTSALMIGGLALAKALHDKELSDKLLNACQNAISDLLSISGESA